MIHVWERTHKRSSGMLLFSRKAPLRQCAFMKKSQTPILCILAFLNIWAVFLAPEPVSGQPPLANGIQPLIQLEHRPLYQLIPLNIRPLLLPQEQEQFLQELEGLPPDWHTLQNLDHTEQSERLFQLNRERDEARLVHKNILQQPIAFLWSGILRQYLPEYQGFSVALGPELTYTSWGIVRFKPMGLPDYLVAIPSLESAGQLLVRQQKGEQIEIGIIFIGTLVTDESLIYGFSHDGREEGMILPVVQIQDIRYFLNIP
jgi:hypothetical protein